MDLLWTSRPCPSSADKFRRCLFFVQTSRPATLPRCIMPPFSTANRKDTQ
ncbi:1-acylglycerol-3-phosphate O-acyltransferase [Neisseria bacilliformis ATCC BAA-1200]|uniref:1-acylglycerol-3-phosphate O-acyltransferase n=1 Tax=Neisseria bacilliformis ATCC BAA-1200 TaxID=888742 RepID=F2BE38_9NEIS|nr:1-acylglycerol-3-phosphate O-acyltransferase [Neisseria bacilliformis ATCC BAA-1200]